MTRPFLLIGSIGVLLSAPLRAATYDWFSATDGGLWSLSANWTPAGGPPVAGDIVNLTDATADRTVTYDSAASGTVGTINFNQTSAFTSTLEVQRALTVTNAITLGSGSGIEELRIISLNSNSSTNTLTAPGITLNNGGRLVLGLGLSNVATTRFAGNVTINDGGELVVTDSLAPKDAAQRSISGTVTATGGSIAIGASQTVGTREARLSISGNFSVAGTAISGSGDAQLILEGATNTIGAGSTFANPGTGSNTITTVLSGGRNQSLESEIKLGNLFFRQFHDGTLIKTVSVADQSGPNVAALQFAGRNNQTIGLKLGSNLKTGSGTQQPFMSGVTQTNANVRFSIDTNGYALELGNTASSWVPAVSGGAATALWSLINSGTPGEGGIKVRGVEFNRTGVTVNIGAGMVLETWGGNGVVNNLGSGTIDVTSTFRYAGTAAASNPATLASESAVGHLEIGNGTASGALKLAGNLTANEAVTIRNLGSFDLGTQALIANNGIAVQAGGILRGGTEATPGLILGDLTAAGTLAPGTTPAATDVTIGALTVSGLLTMETGSTLALELVSGSSFDKVVAGAISLNGTVNLSLSLGASYVHSPGASFLLLENVGGGEIDGLFTWGGAEGVLSEGETFLVGGAPFTITYAGGQDFNDVVITAAVPEPTAILALLCGAGMILGGRRARRRS